MRFGGLWFGAVRYDAVWFVSVRLGGVGFGMAGGFIPPKFLSYII